MAEVQPSLSERASDSEREGWIKVVWPGMDHAWYDEIVRVG